MRERITEGSWAEGGDKVKKYESITTDLAAIKSEIDAGNISALGRLDLFFDKLTTNKETAQFAPDEISGARAHLADLMELAIEKKLILGDDAENYLGYIKELRS